MYIFSNSTLALLERARRNFEKNENVPGFGNAFQHVVLHGLRRITPYKDVYINSGAGQPDIFNNVAGFEVKTTKSAQVALDDNSLTVRKQFLSAKKSFMIAVLRVDSLPYRFWLLDSITDSPATASLLNEVVPGYSVPAELETKLAENIESVIDAVGTRFTDVESPSAASVALKIFSTSMELKRKYELSSQ
jgi:hypothetical protein